MTDDAAAVGGATDQDLTRTLIGFGAMIVGLFLAVFDILIVVSSLGEIRAGLSATVEEISWIQTSFLIAEVITILITGWLTNVFSTRWVFTVAALGFALTSGLCAGAWDIWSMVVFRSFQGLFAGAMVPTVFATVYRALPPHLHTNGLVAISLVITLAPVLGPAVGGWITSSYSWHWIFLINIVPGILVAAAVWFFVDLDRPNLALLKRVDAWGLALIVIFLSTLIYVLEEAPGEDWFDSQIITFLTLVVVFGGVGLIWRELTARYPIIDLSCFRNRNFAIGCVFSFLFGAGMFGSQFLIPVFLVAVRDFNSWQIGLVMMVSGAVQFLIGPLAGRTEKWLPRRVLLMFGFILLATSMFMNATMTSETGFDQLFWPQVVRGAGVIFCMLPITALAIGLLPKAEIANASSIYNLTRTLGGAIGIATLNTLVELRFDHHYLRIAETMRSGSQASGDMLRGLAGHLQSRIGDLGQAELAAVEALRRMAAREATTMAFNDAFLVMGITLLGILVLMPLVKSVAKAQERAE